MRTIIILSLLLLNSSLWGQTTFGIIVDESGNPLPNANVVFFTVTDSVLIDGTITDSVGYFSYDMSNLQNDIILKVYYIGYKIWLKKISKNESNIGKIQLIPDIQMLKGVEIVGYKKSLYTMNGTALNVEVENSILSKLDKLSNMLAYIPFVTITQDGIQVFGKGVPLIYINNHIERDHSKLDNIRPMDVKKIEVITSSSAEYDATTNSVIKITIKRPNGDGLSGNVYSLLALSNYLSETIDCNLNYRNNKVDIFGRMGLRDTRRKSEETKNIMLNDEYSLETWVHNSNLTKTDYWLGLHGLLVPYL